MSTQRQATDGAYTKATINWTPGLISLFLCLFIAGCGGGGSSSPDGSSSAATANSGIRSTTLIKSLVNAPISNDTDDAEESTANGRMDLASSDLELINETGGVGEQLVGLRFTLDLPGNSTITNAYIQFTVDEVSTGNSNLLIRGENTSDAAVFSSNNYNISSRQTTSSSVSWTPPAWNTLGKNGSAQRTPNLNTIVQEVIGLANWQANNHIAFIVSGSGRRAAVSHNGSPGLAPKLFVEYTTLPVPVPGDNNVPVAFQDILTTSVNTASTINILNNDQGIADAPITITISNAPSNGSVSIGQNGAITYIPDLGYSGSDVFTYQISDVDGDTAIANVIINVTPNIVDHFPAANNDSINTNENTPASVNVLNNDTGLEDGGITVTINSAPSNGSVSIGQNDAITYTPNSGYSGSDVFTYRIVDADGDASSASVNVTVNDIDYAPNANPDSAITQTLVPVAIAVLGNDTGTEDGPITIMIVSPPLHGDVTIEQNNSVTYTSNAGYIGSDSFVYSITDVDNDSAVASVEISVVCTSGVCGKTIRVSWNANSESDLAGYYLHHGTQPGVYTDKIWVDNVTSYDFGTLDMTDHFFAISAVDTASNESGRSEEVSISLAL